MVPSILPCDPRGGRNRPPKCGCRVGPPHRLARGALAAPPAAPVAALVAGCVPAGARAYRVRTNKGHVPGPVC
jgi:hypothetical protein